MTAGEGSRTEDSTAHVDYRFLLANERTFLAWIRTSLGLIAGGVALDQFVRFEQDSAVIPLLAILVIASGAVVALTGTVRWMRMDTAMRAGTPVSRSRFIVAVGGIVAALAVAIAAVLWIA